MKKNKPEKSKVILKNYSKIILLYPLLVYSVLALIIQAVIEEITGNERPSLAILWMFIFFINLIMIGFDFPTIKFFILFLVLTLAIVTLILLDVNEVIDLSSILASIRPFFDYSLDTKFYGWATFVLGFTIGGAILQAQLHFVKVEKNEIYVKGLATGKAERFPSSQLHINTEIVDVFELIALGAGKVTMKIGNERIVSLETVPMVRKKKQIIDRLLSSALVSEK